MNFDIKTLSKKIATWLGKACLWFLAISIVWVILTSFIPVPFTPLMGARMIEQKMEGKDIVFQKDWVSIDEINENMILAVICSEDQHFEAHNGFDLAAIKKAIDNNSKRKKRGKPIQGASTISQQVAKNVFLWPSRSWIRKGFEVYFTFLIETIWSKKRIMEVYLNVIEMGNGIYGAEAAALNFYGKHAKDLSRSEAALIAAVLPNPRKWSPKSPTAYINKKQSWIQNQMRYWIDGVDLTDDEVQMPKED